MNSDSTIRVWKTHIAGSQVLTGHQNHIMSFAMHNEVLFTGSLDSSLRIWHVKV